MGKLYTLELEDHTVKILKRHPSHPEQQKAHRCIMLTIFPYVVDSDSDLLLNIKRRRALLSDEDKY